MSYADHIRDSRSVARRKLVCYYAHPMSIYNTPQEQRDIELLEALGFQVLNPNTREHDRAAKLRTRGMDYYESLVDGCDLVAFRALPDGSITCGVASEIKRAKLVIELPSGVSRRALNVTQTLETLSELGQR